MAKKKQTNRGSRPRRPKRIISGITEFIDEDWWEDSRHSSRKKTRQDKPDREEKSTSSNTPAKQESASSEKPKRKKASKARPAAPKTSRREKETVVEEGAETKSRPKRKRVRRQQKDVESATPSPAKQKPVADESGEAPKKKRRRSRRRSKSDEASTSQAAPAEVTTEPMEEESSSSKPKRRRRQSAKKEPSETSRTESVRETTEPKPRGRRKKVVEEAVTAPKRKRSKKVAAQSEEAPRVTRKKVAAETEETPRPKRKKASTKRTAKAASTKAVPPKAVASEKEPTKKAAPKKATPKKKRRVPTKTGFGAMDLSDEILEALELAGYMEPTPIQAGLIPEALKVNDLMGQAQTGTGKTAAFAIPLLELVDYDAEFRGPQALILVPTRELAVQVRDECAKLGDTSEAQVVAVYGGKPIRRQIEKLRRAPEIVVGTPGRVIDLNARGALFFGDLHHVVLDEADRMLDIGFRPDIEKILRRCPEARQTLLLSATLPDPVLRLAKRYMREPQVLDFSPTNIAVETIDQYYFTVDPERKFDLLLKLLERENPTQAIVFCRTRRGTERIYRRLSRQKQEGVACIHGDLAQSARDTTMRKFRDNKLRVLVATDVVGRGIDVSGVSHIINYDIPEFCDDYIHRVGRTGRMGREGVAYSFISPEEGPQLTRIEMRINLLLERAEMPGFDMGIKAVPEENETPPESKPVYGRPKRRLRRAL